MRCFVTAELHYIGMEKSLEPVVDAGSLLYIDLQKAGAGHKYVRRTGSPGAYKYWYRLPDGSLSAGDQHQQSGRLDHVKRLLVSRMQGSHQLSNAEVAAETGHPEQKVRSIQSNLRTGARQKGRLEHDYSSDHLREHETVGKTMPHPGSDPVEQRRKAPPAGETKTAYRGKLSRLTGEALQEEARKHGVSARGTDLDRIRNEIASAKYKRSVPLRHQIANDKARKEREARRAAKKAK